MKTPTKGTRQYQGEVEARTLVDYLNSRDPESNKGRALLQKLMKTVHTALPFFDHYVANYPTRDEDDIKEPGQTEIDEFEKEISQLAARYKRELRFAGAPEMDFYWALPRPWNFWELKESKAVDAVVSLSRENLLRRVQECGCNRWFFARFSHQHFCSSKCRDKYHQSSPEFKQKRRKYMRGYYQLQKRTNVL